MTDARNKVVSDSIKFTVEVGQFRRTSSSPVVSGVVVVVVVVVVAALDALQQAIENSKASEPKQVYVGCRRLTSMFEA
eukprot:3709573-Lingulodinium_polyedra.AAC.1